MTHTCNHCHKPTARTPAPSNKPDRKTVFVDDTGREWYGFKCPDCRYGAKDLKVGKSHHPCPQCKGPMAATRYFQCEACQPVLNEDIDALYC